MTKQGKSIVGLMRAGLLGLLLFLWPSSSFPAGFYCQDWESSDLNSSPSAWTLFDRGQGATALIKNDSNLVGRALQTDPKGDWLGMFYVGESFTDVTLTALVDTGDLGVLMARTNGAFGYDLVDNGYYFSVRPNATDGTVLARNIGGGYGQLALGSTSGLDPTHFTMQFVVVGNQLSGYVNGVLVVGPVTDNFFASGYVGVMSLGGPTYYDNIQVDTTCGFNITPSPTPSITRTSTPTPTASPTPTATPAVLAPTGLFLGPELYRTCILYWDVPVDTTQFETWKIYFNGALQYDVRHDEVWNPYPGTWAYLMRALPEESFLSITAQAFIPGRRPSGVSNPVTMTTQ